MCILHDKMEHMSTSACGRMHKRAGIKSITSSSQNIIRNIANDRLCEILRNANLVCKLSNNKTINEKHIRSAIENSREGKLIVEN